MDFLQASSIGGRLCFVCRNAGKPIFTWPQYPTVPIDLVGENPDPDNPLSYSNGKWYVFTKVNGSAFDDGRRIVSKHREIEMCGTHWIIEMKCWIDVAQEEVSLDYIYNQWLDRIGR